jgi:sugar-specific transcriptional regulator TrmB
MLYLNFERLGLSESEGKVYVALLELGGGFVSSIAKRAKLPRVNCYHTLEKLTEKGLVSCITKENVRYYLAETPTRIISTLEERVKYAKHVLPDLVSITNAQALKPQIKYFEGIAGLHTILEDTLSAKELLGYSNLQGASDLLGEYLITYAQKKIERNIKTRLICPSSQKAFNYIQTYYPQNYPPELVEILFINPQEFWFEHEIMIYNNKVAVISLNPEELIGMIFESPVYAKSQRAIFNLAWLGASSFIAL